MDLHCCLLCVQANTLVQSQTAVSAYCLLNTSKQILPFGFAEQNTPASPGDQQQRLYKNYRVTVTLQVTLSLDA